MAQHEHFDFVVTRIIPNAETRLITLVTTRRTGVNAEKLTVNQAPSMQVRVPIRGAVSGFGKLRDVLALIEQVRFDFGSVPANPERDMKKWSVAVTWILFPEHVSERNSPILIYVPLHVLHFGCAFVVWHHHDFRGAVEKRHVRPLQFVTKVNRKRDRSRRRALLAAGNGITATRRAPPRAALFGFRSTVKTYPRLAGDREIHRQTAAARDGPTAAILNCRHPTVRFVPTNIATALRSEHDRVFRDSRWAVTFIRGLRCGRLRRCSRCRICRR